jgi:ubiquitin-protein ligase
MPDGRFFETPRTRRLRRDFDEMRILRDESTILEFETEGDPPDRYRIVFHGKGLESGSRIRDVHELEMGLGAEYPHRLPVVRWTTPILHPNMEGGRAPCFGSFAMTPYVRLTEIVEILWDMARMAIFNLGQGAGAWHDIARAVGGFPVDPRILRDKAPPAPPSVEEGPEIEIMGPTARRRWRLDPEAVKTNVETYLRVHDLDFDARVHTQEEWRRRGEKYGNDAVVTITTEGPLGRLLNYGDWPGSEEEIEDWSRFIVSMGLYWDLGYAWSVHLYPSPP